MYRCFKNFDVSLFQADLVKSPLESIDTVTDPNHALEMLYDILNNLLLKHAPIKEKKNKTKTQPNWFTDE
jgi:hypothetical protein